MLLIESWSLRRIEEEGHPEEETFHKGSSHMLIYEVFNHSNKLSLEEKWNSNIMRKCETPKSRSYIITMYGYATDN